MDGACGGKHPEISQEDGWENLLAAEQVEGLGECAPEETTEVLRSFHMPDPVCLSHRGGYMYPLSLLFIINWKMCLPESCESF